MLSMVAGKRGDSEGDLPHGQLSLSALSMGEMKDLFKTISVPRMVGKNGCVSE